MPGHWEGDLIMGATNTLAIGTLVERATGFLCLIHLPGDHTAMTIQTAICEQMAELPQTLRQTLTWDRGSEMTNHAPDRRGHRPGHLLRRSRLTLAARQQREHQRTAPTVLPQGHRPVPLGTRIPRAGRPGDEQPTPQTPRLRRTPAEALDQLLSEHDEPPGVALTG